MASPRYACPEHSDAILDIGRKHVDNYNASIFVQRDKHLCYCLPKCVTAGKNVHRNRGCSVGKAKLCAECLMSPQSRSCARQARLGRRCARVVRCGAGFGRFLPMDNRSIVGRYVYWICCALLTLLRFLNVWFNHLVVQCSDCRVGCAVLHNLICNLAQQARFSFLVISVRVDI